MWESNGVTDPNDNIIMYRFKISKFLPLYSAFNYSGFRTKFAKKKYFMLSRLIPNSFLCFRINEVKNNFEIILFLCSQHISISIPALHWNIFMYFVKGVTKCSASLTVTVCSTTVLGRFDKSGIDLFWKGSCNKGFGITFCTEEQHYIKHIWFENFHYS